MGVRFFDGVICWIAGPVKGAENDLVMARNFDSLGFTHSWERCLADLGYVGWSERCLTGFKRTRGALSEQQQGDQPQDRILPCDCRTCNR